MWSSIRRLFLGVFLIALASAILLVSDVKHRRPSGARLSQVAILQHSSQPAIDDGVQGMLAALADAGFVDGKTIAVRRYNAQNDLPTANTIAKEITGGGFDLILTASTLSLQAVANANKDGKTVHVFGLVSDPSAAGVGISHDNPLQHPRHLVGYGTLQPVADAFRLARRMLPGLHTVGEVWNPAEANSEVQTRIAREICRTLGIDLVEANAENASAVSEAVNAVIARDVQAIWVPGDVAVLTAVDAVVARARNARIPVFTSIPGNAEHGALFDLGANYLEVGRLTGGLAAEILKGKDPATVAIENVLPEKLVVNPAALAGLKDPWQVPEDVLRSAQVVGKGQPAAEEHNARAAPAGRMFKIGLVYFAPEPGVEDCMRGLFDGLRALGFEEGKNLEVHKAHAQGEITNIPALLQNYDGQNFDLIVPMTTPCLTGACGMVKRTPVVFTYVYDPIAAGAGSSFTDHNPNVTGVGSFPPVEETIDLIQRLLPGVKTVGTLYNSSEANSRKVVAVGREIFTKHDIRLEEVSITNASEVFQAAQALMARGIQVLWIAGDNTAIQGFDGIVKVANDARVPLVTNDVEPVANASLATVGIGFYESGYAAAKLAARVMLGENPKDVPIENVAVKAVSLNTDVARRLGVTLPKDVIESAAVLVDAAGQHRRASGTPPAPLSKTWQVDVLEYVNVLDVEEGERGILAGLHEAGLVEGRDYRVRVRNAQGDMPTLSALVDAALTAGTDLIMTLSTPTLQATLQRARGVPIVFTFVADAVVAGAGRSNQDHLPNVTGVPSAGPYEEILAIVREILPSLRRVGTLFVPAEVNSVYNKDLLTAAASKVGVETVALAANTSSELPDAAAALCSQPIDAVIQIGGNLTSAGFVSIAQAAKRARLPLFGLLSGDARNGAALVVARDFYEGGRQAGLMAARVMRGESPAHMPFEPLTHTKLIVDLQAARALGLTIPAAIVQRAAEVRGR